MRAGKPCRGRGCGNLRDPRHLLCRRCWARVPEPLRAAFALARALRREKRIGWPNAIRRADSDVLNWADRNPVAAAALDERDA